MEIGTNNNKIRILAIGDNEYLNSLSRVFLFNLTETYSLETISNEKQALKRLNHNSYDVLLLQDGFTKYNTIRLSTMAYAMSRPTIIICKSIFKQFLYSYFWKPFSKFTRRFKTSRKLIFFTINNSNNSELVKYLAENHLQYFEIINSEISKQVGI